MANVLQAGESVPFSGVYEGVLIQGSIVKPPALRPGFTRSDFSWMFAMLRSGQVPV